jgi:alpha-L-fucosidase
MSGYHSVIKYEHADHTCFTESRFGMFIHWGAYSLAARHEWVKSSERITDEGYAKYPAYFDPDLYDPRAWARAAREAGIRYFVITTKHHEGFCLWDTAQTDYKVMNSPYGKDVLTPMVEAFRAEDLRIGLYHSLIDWHHPDFTVDRYYPQRDDAAARAKNANRDMKKYAAYLREQVRELCTGFGKIDIFWFAFSYPGEDGKCHTDWESEKLVAVVKELQPQALINRRMDIWEAGDFETPEQVQIDRRLTDRSGKPLVWEACQTFSGSWGYHRDEATWKSVDQLLRMLVDGVSKDGNLLLNVGPTGRDEFDDRAMDRLAGMGRWMKYHGRSISVAARLPTGYPPRWTAGIRSIRRRTVCISTRSPGP